MASRKEIKKRCVKCAEDQRTSNVFTCNGCERSFCARHVNQHRDELNTQLELITQDCDLIKDGLNQSSINHLLFKDIDVWEKRMVKKIQTTAEIARNDLRELVNRSNQRMMDLFNDLANNIRSVRKTEDFSESELDQWKEKLNQLKNELNSPVDCRLDKDRENSIYLIKIQLSGDRFGEIYGPVQLDRGNLRSKYIGDNWEHGRIRGEKKYFQDNRAKIRFKIERSFCPAQLFFGITTSNAILDQRLWSGPSTVGWSGDNKAWEHGVMNDLTGQSANGQFESGDILQLNLNCKEQEIQLYNERTKVTHSLSVNINQTPFPWHFLIGLHNDSDCMTIL